MNVLSIGNSFSQDAQRFLHAIAAADGVELDCANLYVGGCSLEQHAAFLESGEPVYDREWNGAPAGQKISLRAAVESRPWDIITLQQASHLSGDARSYFPYLEQLAAYLRQTCPQTALYLHETWAYEPDSTHPAFVRYGSDMAQMYGQLREAYYAAARRLELPLIPVGDGIQRLREEVPAFDRSRGGRSLTRDGFHLSWVYGRYAAGLIWYRALTGRDVCTLSYVPADPQAPDETDSAVLQAIRRVVAQLSVVNPTEE